MTVRELYKHITKYMTAEQALIKLLEGSIIQYENLKFDDKDKAVHPVLIIAMAAIDMGWNLAIEDENKESDIRGICVGTKEYMDTIFPEKS